MNFALGWKAGSIVALSAVLFVSAGGCATKPKATDASVLDVSKSPYGAGDANYAPPPYAGSLAAYPGENNTSGYTPAPPPAAAITQTPTYAPSAAPAGGSYVVRKGDTYFRIARDHYGDPKQWPRIAAANPGVSPNSLKVGQKIVVP